jgi:hypothetical protein
MALMKKIPPISAPIYRKANEVAKANNPNQTAILNRITGRPPQRSVSTPMTGANRTVVRGARVMTTPT